MSVKKQTMVLKKIMKNIECFKVWFWSFRKWEEVDREEGDEGKKQATESNGELQEWLALLFESVGESCNELSHLLRHQGCLILEKQPLHSKVRMKLQ